MKKLQQISEWIYSIDGTFKFKWIKTKGFWKMIAIAIVTKFGFVYHTKDHEGLRISVGADLPLDSICADQYSAQYMGKILGVSVYQYESLEPKAFGQV